VATVPTPLTAVTGRKISSASFNSGVRDPLAFLTNGAPALQVVQNVSQAAFAASTWTDITFDAEVLDLDGQHSTVSNTARVNIGNTLGYYLVCGVVLWQSNASGTSRRARLAKNGAALNGSFAKAAVGDGAIVSSVTPTMVVQSTAATDYLTLQGWHDATSSIGTVVTGEARSSLTVLFLRGN